MLNRRRWSWLVPVALLLAACEQRRPTAQELARFESHSNQVLVGSIVWLAVALGGAAFCVWDWLRRRGDDPPPWPMSVLVLVGIATALMLLTALTFVPLWTA